MRTQHTFVTCSAVALAAILVLLNVAPASAGGAKIIVINNNNAGVGFNDPTPATPVGGNSGTTLGQQWLIAFEHAAKLWGETLDSKIPIYVRAQFTALPANVLGSAGPTHVARDFAGLDGMSPGVEFSGTWYGGALADKRAGVDFLPPNPAIRPDVRATFSTNFNFYLGLDNNHGARVDLVTVVLHELGHGLNFLTFVDAATGQNFGATEDNPSGGFTDIYARHLVNSSTGLHWNEMTVAERQASATKFGRLVWAGANVTAGLTSVLSFGSPEVRVTAPAAIARAYQFGTAVFGPRVGNPNVSGTVVAAQDPADAAGPTTTDACSTLTNAAAVAGNIALIERGTCGFVVKARIAEAAGAIAAIIYNNVANAGAAPPGMATDTGPPVTIPAVSLTRADGLAIVAQLAGTVTANIGVDMTIRAGADESGRARMYAPFPFAGGSSVSHYDTVARRNLLMEPGIGSDLTHKLKAPDDLTIELFRDIGWFPDADLDGVADQADCSPQSIQTATILIGGRDTTVPNTLFTTGCTISDRIAKIAAAAETHGGFVSGVARLAESLIASGVITEAQKELIMPAAAAAKN